MDRDTHAQPNEWDGTGELPDVPDAGDGAQPLVPPDPIDFSTSTIAADGAQLAATFGDDDRTLYEQALEVFEDDDSRIENAEVRIEKEDAGIENEELRMEKGTPQGGARTYDN